MSGESTRPGANTPTPISIVLTDNRRKTIIGLISLSNVFLVIAIYLTKLSEFSCRTFDSIASK